MELKYGDAIEITNGFFAGVKGRVVDYRTREAMSHVRHETPYYEEYRVQIKDRFGISYVWLGQSQIRSLK